MKILLAFDGSPCSEAAGDTIAYVPFVPDGEPTLDLQLG